jgi:hypothetical protein
MTTPHVSNTLASGGVMRSAGPLRGAHGSVSTSEVK